jgi:hypothetical protein
MRANLINKYTTNVRLHIPPLDHILRDLIVVSMLRLNSLKTLNVHSKILPAILRGDVINTHYSTYLAKEINMEMCMFHNHIPSSILTTVRL